MRLIPVARRLARCSRGTAAVELGIIAVMISTVLVYGLNGISERLRFTFAAIGSASHGPAAARPQGVRTVADRED